MVDVQGVGRFTVERTAADVHIGQHKYAAPVAPERAAVDICRIAARIDRTDIIELVYIGAAARVRGLDRAAVHGKRAAARPHQHSRVAVELLDRARALAAAVLNGQVAAMYPEHGVPRVLILALVLPFPFGLGHREAVQVQRDRAGHLYALSFPFLQRQVRRHRHILQHRHRAAGVFFRRRERRRQRGILHALVLGLVGAGGHHGNAVLPALHRRVLPHRIGGVGRSLFRLALRRDQLGPCRRGQHAEHHHKAHEQTDDPSLHLSSSPSISFQVFYC